MDPSYAEKPSFPLGHKVRTNREQPLAFHPRLGPGTGSVARTIPRARPISIGAASHGSLMGGAGVHVDVSLAGRPAARISIGSNVRLRTRARGGGPSRRDHTWHDQLSWTGYMHHAYAGLCICMHVSMCAVFMRTYRLALHVLRAADRPVDGRWWGLDPGLCTYVHVRLLARQDVLARSVVFCSCELRASLARLNWQAS